MPLSAAQPECGYIKGTTNVSVMIAVEPVDSDVKCTFDAGAVSRGTHTVQVYTKTPAPGGVARIIFSFRAAQH